jgi:SNF2 family DNA or RNA helicase
MKTKGMSQQIEALRRMNGRTSFALFMEQGTGKTWTILADVERLYAAGKIDALLVIAPKGVHTNWVRREIPAHMDVPIVARAWKSGAGKRETAKLEALFAPREAGEPVPLRVLSMNIDALNTDAGMKFAMRFLRACRALLAIDESSRIKTPGNRRTLAAMRLRQMAEYARIASGTPITKAPGDVFAQMEFLESGLLGTTSFRAFYAEYAELMDKEHPMMANMIKRNPKMAHAQIVKKNVDGTPVWRNLDKLQRYLAPHSYRVLKKDCLDLPDKIYKNVYFDLDPKQQRAYDFMREELRVDLGDGMFETVRALAALNKLQQITSGFVMLPDREPMYIAEGNPRLAALMEIAEDAPGKFIVWARFKEEIKAIATGLAMLGFKCVEYHGEVNERDREIAVDRFQGGDADVFIGQPQSGGIGLTLTAAEWVIYFSNDYNLETRLQSEDRAHRIGTTKHVVYTDIVAAETIDEKVAANLQLKKAMASLILGDARSEVGENSP